MTRSRFTLDYTREIGGTYFLPGSCDNCGGLFNVKLDKGHSRPTSRIDCPHCGCRAVRVSSEQWKR